MKKLLIGTLAIACLAGCGTAPVASVSPKGATAATASAHDKADLKVLKQSSYTATYLLTVKSGDMYIEYTFADTPLNDEPTSPARIDIVTLDVNGKALDSEDFELGKKVANAVAAAAKSLDKKYEKMLTTAAGAITYYMLD